MNHSDLFGKDYACLLSEQLGSLPKDMAGDFINHLAHYLLKSATSRQLTLQLTYRVISCPSLFFLVMFCSRNFFWYIAKKKLIFRLRGASSRGEEDQIVRLDLPVSY